MLPFAGLEAFLARPYSPAIVDAHGTVLRQLPLSGGLWREHTPLPGLPRDLVEIFRKSEDGRFYAHAGVDLSGLLRALAQNARAGEIVSGGSTITMQLARLVRPHSGGVGGKMTEALTAVRLEAKISKDRILELWINSIPFGSQVEGVTSAAWSFFGVSPAELSLEQMLLLAVIPRRPVSYDPRTRPEAASGAALQLASRIGLEVQESRVKLAARSTAPRPDKHTAPHFVRLVARELSDDDLAGDGRVLTTLEPEIQRTLEAAIRARVQSSVDFRIGNGAGIVVDNETGGILAYVGSVDYDDADTGQIDGVRILRQPGSTLKPFLYALALDSGFTAATILPDIPIEFGGREIYVPQNFNRRFNGPVRLRTALASSLNVPAVYTIERVGVRSFATYLVSLGFDSMKPQLDSVGTGLALGNAEVSLYELARAFTVFVRDGVPAPVHWDPARVPAARRVMPAWVAGTIRDILSDRRSRIPGFGTRSLVETGVDILFKTGTSNQFNNIWAVGSSASLTVAVWMGNFGGETVIGTPGSSLPAAVVLELLGLHTDPALELPDIDGVHQVDICATSGHLATSVCPAVIPELFPRGRMPEECSWHISDSLPVRYPPEYQAWALERDYVVASDPSGTGETVRISQPSDGAVFYYDPTVPASSQAVRVEVLGNAVSVQLYLNDSFLAEGPLPLVTTLPIRRGTFELSAVTQSAGHGTVSRVEVEVR